MKIVLNAIGLALLVHVFLKNRDSFREVIGRGPDFRLLALAFAICLAGLVATFVRWMIVVRAQGLGLRLIDAVRVGFMGNAIDLVIPGQVGGDVFKATFLGRVPGAARPRPWRRSWSTVRSASSASSRSRA